MRGLIVLKFIKKLFGIGLNQRQTDLDQFVTSRRPTTAAEVDYLVRVFEQRYERGI